jgi:RNA polymerase sigma-70 factor (ECF subfamily)
VSRELPDELLMERYQQGDARAFEILVERHQGPVFNFILRYVGETTAAEDVLQELFLRVVKGATTFQRRAKFTTWLYTIARNLCIDAKRKARYRRTESLDAPVDDDPESPVMGAGIAHQGPSAEDSVQDARARQVLIRAMESLSPEQQEVFVLREYAGMPFQEIAEIVGCSENTVKSRMRYALENLRKVLVRGGVTREP